MEMNDDECNSFLLSLHQRMAQDEPMRDLIAKGFRPVSKRRARKLAKKFNFVFWNSHHDTWMWKSSIVKGDKNV